MVYVSIEDWNVFKRKPFALCCEVVSLIKILSLSVSQENSLPEIKP